MIWLGDHLFRYFQWQGIQERRRRQIGPRTVFSAGENGSCTRAIASGALFFFRQEGLQEDDEDILPLARFLLPLVSIGSVRYNDLLV